MNKNSSKNLKSTIDAESREKIFSNEFLNMEIENIVNQIDSKGYFFFEGAMQSTYADEIVNECTSIGLGFNSNNVAPVRNFRQTFFSNCLAHSQSSVNLVCSEIILSIARTYLGPEYRLKCQRYYESCSGYQLGWHTDNKTVDNKKTDVKGIVFIFYLCDTFDGELEVVAGSNKWSGANLSNDFDDSNLRANYSKEIVSLAGKKGSLIVTDTWTVHRTAMLKDPNFKRKSFFLQIDNDLLHSEKIIINPELFPSEMNSEILQYLGFGRPSGYKTMPASGLNTLNAADLVFLIAKSMMYLILRVPYLRKTVLFFYSRASTKSNVING